MTGFRETSILILMLKRLINIGKARLSALVILLLLSASIPLTIGLTQKRQDIRTRAVESSTTGAVRGIAGDLWADIVLGKPDFHESNQGEIVPFKVFNPGGAIVDRTIRPNRVYTYDGANSRILGFRSLGSCQNNSGVQCTTDSDCPGSTCQIRVGGQLGSKKADIVIGQPDFNHAACNGDGNFEQYPNRVAATASSLCSIPEDQTSPNEGGSYANMAIDTEGNLYVGDFDNNRVLKYIKPFETDTVADEVWGQADFSGVWCNRVVGSATNRYAGLGKPQNNTFCFRSPFNKAFGTGVDIDAGGNLWVTDSTNHRVLRFSKDTTTGVISKTADLVLGQPDFTSFNGGSALNQMYSPVAIRVATSGKVYVADSINNRILVFDPPFNNGQTASGIFASNVKSPTGLEFDPSGEGIWVNDTGNYQLVLFGFDGTVKKVLFKDTYQANGRCGSTTSGIQCINPQIDPKTGQSVCWDIMCNVGGSFGVDTDNNIYVTGSSFAQDLYRFKAPLPTPQLGKVYSATNRFFYPPDDGNFVYGKKGFASPRGIVVAAGQLIVADGARIMFWNIPNGISDLLSNKDADGVAGVTNFDKKDAWGFWHIAAEGNTALWVMRKSTIERYPLPLTHGYTPPPTSPTDPNTRQAVITFNTAYPVLGTDQQITFDFRERFDDIEVTPDGKFLYIVQSEKNRILRFRDVLTNPVIDVILGQKTVDGIVCNQDDPNYRAGVIPWGASKPLNYLCRPGSVAFDHFGNLFVSDHSLEVEGNMRMLIFKKNDHAFLQDPQNVQSVLLGPTASQVIPAVSAWEPAFNSQNHMVVGYNGYALGGRFPGAYLDPLSQITPINYSKDYFSMATAATFDSEDNLYIADLNRGRVLVYKNPFGTLITPQPTTPFVPTATPTPSPTPVPPPTSTPPIVEVTQPIVGDSIPPTVSITNPINNSVLNRNATVTISVTASDNVAVSKVDFWVSSTFKCTDTTTPYTCQWKIPGKPNANYQIEVFAYDAAGNSSRATSTVSSK